MYITVGDTANNYSHAELTNEEVGLTTHTQ